MCCCCAPLRWLLTALGLVLFFIVTGYLGKFFVAFEGSRTAVLLSATFWTPDAAFWISGLVCTGTLLLTVALLSLLCAGVRRLICGQREAPPARYRELDGDM